MIIAGESLERENGETLGSLLALLELSANVILIEVGQNNKPGNAAMVTVVNDVGCHPEGRPCFPVNQLLSNHIHEFGKDWFISRTIREVLTGGNHTLRLRS